MLTPGTPRIAGAFDLQVVPQVPAAPHDLIVDAIATPTRMLTMAAAMSAEGRRTPRYRASLQRERNGLGGPASVV